MSTYNLFRNPSDVHSTTHRSLLFFVIRDHVGHTPLANLANTLKADLNRIWDSLTKPAGLESSQIADFFDFEFTTLPHKLLQPEQFLEQTKELRKRFADGVSPEIEGMEPKPQGSQEGVFLPVYHRRIPADGFPMYAESIWEQIVTNKDLDLPSQQELLAQFRCDEIAANVTAVFNAVINPFESQAQSGRVLEGLGPAMNSSLCEAIASFEESGGRYHKGVFQRKRDDLRHALETRLRSLTVVQFQALSKRAVAEFTDEVTNVLKKANASHANSAYDFARIVEEAKQHAVERFKEDADACFIPGETTSWSSSADELSELQKDIDTIAARLRGEEMKRLVTRLEKSIKTRLTEPIELEFKRMDETLWDRIWKQWTHTVDEAVHQFEAKSKSFNATDSEREIGIYRLKKRGWAVLRAKIDEEVLEGNLLLKLRENFEDKFRYDEHGVPRVWKPTDDIEGAYTRAREATLLHIPLISHFHLTSTSSPPDLTSYLGPTPPDSHDDDTSPLSSDNEFEILSEAKQHDLTQRFKRTADAVFVEAKRSAIGGVAQVPVWVYGAMLALGWNELWAVLRSPMYFMMLLILAAGAYVVYTLNLAGPMVRVGNAMVEQGVEVGKVSATILDDDGEGGEKD